MLNSENLAVYEIMWNEYVRARQATGDNIIRRMRFACRYLREEYIHTRIIFNKYVLLLQQLLRERASMLVLWLLQAM